MRHAQWDATHSQAGVGGCGGRVSHGGVHPLDCIEHALLLHEGDLGARYEALPGTFPSFLRKPENLSCLGFGVSVGN